MKTTQACFVVLAFWLAACSSSSDTPPTPGGQAGSGTDAAGETGNDASGDTSTATDTTPDNVPASETGQESSAQDSSQDTTAEASQEDGSQDAISEPPEPVDVQIPDTGTALSAQCSSGGGALCTNFRWEICPVGFEPVDSVSHLGCGLSDGWCCKPAPASTCSASGKGNCVPECPKDCWAPVSESSLTCETGRSCCRDICK